VKPASAAIALGLSVLVTGCKSTSPSWIPAEGTAPAVAETPSPTLLPATQPTRTPPPLPPTSGPTSTPVPTSLPSMPPEAQLEFRCLDVLPTLPHDATSDGTVVLESRVAVDRRLKPETFLLDMATGQVTQIAMHGERQVRHIVSPDRTLMAFESVAFDDEGKILGSQLIVATADGHRLKAISWEDGWIAMPAWLDNQHLIINLAGLDEEENTGRKPATMLVLNPFNGERRILRAGFPGFLSSTSLPYWDGWSGVVYDPTLTRVIYPSVSAQRQYGYTYAIQDLSKQELVASLDSVFAPTLLSAFFPMPRWSPDGSQFAFEGLALQSGQSVIERELYRVSRDGQPEQLTHLVPIMQVQDQDFSWSPDAHYIAMYLDKYYSYGQWNTSRVAVLDTAALHIVDYCLPVTYAGDGYACSPLVPIWSPNGKQFLVVDWYEKEHRRVILVDIAEGFAAEIAQDMQPMGWMVIGK
jgi:hypothetical protein